MYFPYFLYFIIFDITLLLDFEFNIFNNIFNNNMFNLIRNRVHRNHPYNYKAVLPVWLCMEFLTVEWLSQKSNLSMQVLTKFITTLTC